MKLLRGQLRLQPTPSAKVSGEAPASITWAAISPPSRPPCGLFHRTVHEERGHSLLPRLEFSPGSFGHHPERDKLLPLGLCGRRFASPHPPPMHPGSCVSEAATVGPFLSQEALRKGAYLRESKGAASLPALAVLTPSSSCVNSKTGQMAENGRLLGSEQYEVVFSWRSPLLHHAVPPGPPPRNQRRRGKVMQR